MPEDKSLEDQLGEIEASTSHAPEEPLESSLNELEAETNIPESPAKPKPKKSYKPGETIEGEVKWYDNEKGYGFVTGLDGIEYCILHSDLSGISSLCEGDHVFFKGCDEKLGKTAKNVTLTKGEIKKQVPPTPPKPKALPKPPTKQEQARTLCNQAEDAWFKGSKIKLLRQAVELDPNFADAHFNLASIYFQKKEYLRAAKEYELTRDIDRDSGDLLATISILIGNAYAAGKEYLKAIPHFKTALKIKPLDMGAIYSLAYCFEHKGSLNSALEQYHKLKELSSWLSSERKLAKEGISRLEATINAQRQPPLRREVPVARAYPEIPARVSPQRQDPTSLLELADSYAARAGNLDEFRQAYITYKKAFDAGDNSFKRRVSKKLMKFHKKCAKYMMKEADRGNLIPEDLLILGQLLLETKDDIKAMHYLSKAKDHPAATSTIKQQAAGLWDKTHQNVGLSSAFESMWYNYIRGKGK